jgi:LuxR family maltose regulon positive regulatory protein
MTTPLLTTKLYIPPVRPRERVVPRPRLIGQLNEGVARQRGGFARKLTLISAPAGFGKTTLVSEWVQAMGGATPSIAIAWLSLDESDNDPACFLTYMIAALQAALQTIEPNIGQGALNALQSPQVPQARVILTALINEIAALPDRMVLVLDDYHLIQAQPVHDALTFLLEHLPPLPGGMHLVLATREDQPDHGPGPYAG